MGLRSGGVWTPGPEIDAYGSSEKVHSQWVDDMTLVSWFAGEAHADGGPTACN